MCYWWIPVIIKAVEEKINYDDTKKANKDIAKSVNASLATQQEQIDDKASAEANERTQEARKERGRILAMAADSGAAGNALFAQLRDSMMQEGTSTSRTDLNRRNAIASARAEANARLQSLPRPNAMASVLRVAGTAFSSYSNSG